MEFLCWEKTEMLVSVHMYEERWLLKSITWIGRNAMGLINKHVTFRQPALYCGIFLLNVGTAYCSYILIKDDLAWSDKSCNKILRRYQRKGRRKNINCGVLCISALLSRIYSIAPGTDHRFKHQPHLKPIIQTNHPKNEVFSVLQNVYFVRHCLMQKQK